MRDNTMAGRGTQRGLAKLSLLVIMLAVVIAAGAAAGGAWFYFYRGTPKSAAAQKPPPPEKPVFVKLDPFTINLGDDSGRVLYVGLSLKVGDDKVADRINARIPQVRNRILMTLSDETADRLTTSRGKQALAASLRDAIRKPYAQHTPALPVSKVLFTDFIVQ